MEREADHISNNERFSPNQQEETKKSPSKSEATDSTVQLICRPYTSSQSTDRILREIDHSEFETPGLSSSQFILNTRILDEKEYSLKFISTINRMRALKENISTSFFMSFASGIRASNNVYGMHKSFSCGDIWAQGEASVNSLQSSTDELTRYLSEEELNLICETDHLIKEFTDDVKQQQSELVKLLDQSSEDKEKSNVGTEKEAFPLQEHLNIAEQLPSLSNLVIDEPNSECILPDYSHSPVKIYNAEATFHGEKVLKNTERDAVDQTQRYCENLQEVANKSISQSICQPSTSSQSTQANPREPEHSECEPPDLSYSISTSNRKILEEIIKVYDDISQILILKAELKLSLFRQWSLIHLFRIQNPNKVSRLPKSSSCSDIWTQEEAFVEFAESQTDKHRIFLYQQVGEFINEANKLINEFAEIATQQEKQLYTLLSD